MAGIPDALRIGTPVSERGNNPYDNLPAPRRVSAPTEPLAPRRPSDGRDIVSPISPQQRGFSYSSLSSGRGEPQQSSSYYAVPEAPPLPTIDTFGSGYHPFSPFDPQGAQPAFKQKPSLISLIGSIRSTRLTRRSKYGPLVDQDEERGGPLGNLAEDEGESIGVDLSGFEGGNIAMRDFAKARPSTALQSPGKVGGGMGQVMTTAIVERSATIGHKRGKSLQDPETRKTAQMIAEAQGEILAVEAILDDGPAVDLGHLGGGDYQKRNTIASIGGVGGGGDTQKSYFFPADPEKPKWKPFSMKWPYLTILVVIGVVLAGLQEFLCQLSMRRGKDDGLIKFTDPKQIPTAVYFAWKYLPTIVLVTYGVMWQVTDYECKRLEPYYQLSKRSGATAGESLNLDYLTFMSYLIPIRAALYKQWAVLYSSLATLMAGGLLAVLQSVSIVVEPPTADREDNQPKFVRVSPIWSRALEGVLILIAAYGVLLIVQLRRKSGLLSDPKGIAGVAAMATKSHILNDFKGLDIASNHTIHQQLRNRRYNLHKSSLWQGEFIREDDKLKFTKAEHPHPVMLRLIAGIPFVILIGAFGTLIPLFTFMGRANMILEKFPWLLTAVATSIKLLWNCLDINVRVVEPYYILSRRHAPPKTLTLDYTGTVPGYLILQAARNRHWLVSVVGLGNILAEVLTVCVTSFSVDGRRFISGQGGDERSNTGETFRSFWISFALALGCLVYLAAVASLVYARRRHKFLPRQPGTIAGVMAYIHQSRMLEDFIDTEKFNSEEMTRHFERIGKTYALGWFNGRDGEDHCGVDQEPVLASYKHGFDWTASRLQSNQIGTWEHF